MLPDESTQPGSVLRVKGWRDRLRFGLVGVAAMLTFRRSSWFVPTLTYFASLVVLPVLIAARPVLRGESSWETVGLVAAAMLVAPVVAVLYGAVSSTKPGRRVYGDVRRTVYLQIDISEGESVWKFSGHVKAGQADAQLLRRDVLGWLLPQAAQAGATVELTAAHWKLAKKYSSDLKAAEASLGATPGALEVWPSGRLEMIWTPKPLVSPGTPSATPQAGSLAG